MHSGGEMNEFIQCSPPPPASDSRTSSHNWSSCASFYMPAWSGAHGDPAVCGDMVILGGLVA